MGETANSFLKRFVGFSIGPVLSSLLGFITLPVTTWLIAPDEFGKVAMFTLAYSMLSMFLYLGVDVAFMREYNVNQDKYRLFWNSITLPLVLSGFFAVVIVFADSEISKMLFDAEQKFVIKLLAVSLPFAVLSKFNQLVIRLQERAKIFSFLIVFRQLSKFLFTILFILIFDPTFEYIVLAQVSSTVLQGLLSGLFITDYYYNPKNISWHILKPLIIFGLPFLPTALIEWLFNGFDKVALRKWGDFAEIGLYSAGFKIIALLGIFRTSFKTFWTPTVYKWHETGVGSHKFQKVNDIITSVMIIIGGVIILLRDFIFIILAPEYASAAAFVPFLIYIPIFETIRGTTVSGITLSRKTWVLIPIHILSVIFNVGGNILLVPHFGALGASITTGMSFLLTFWLYTYISRYLWNIKLDFSLMTINSIILTILAFGTLLNIFFIELFCFIIIMLLNIKSINYLIRKYPPQYILSLTKNKIS